MAPAEAGRCRMRVSEFHAPSRLPKVNVTFGDDVDGIDSKAGMRVSW